jgi:AcrR family transcriptional regulator
MPNPRRVNQGRRVALQNRAALVQAAREVLSEQGFDAPLSLIARRAQVGQGSLYRHFPTRAAVVSAVFENNVTELEALAASPDSTLDYVLSALVDQIVSSVALGALITPNPIDPGLTEIRQRIRTLLGSKVTGPRRDIELDEIELAVAMLAALLARTKPSERALVAARGRELIGRILRP